MKHKKRVWKRITAVVCTMAVTFTGIPGTGWSVKAATPAETANVMIDSGGYKTEPLGKGTADWGNTHQNRTDTLPPSDVYLTENYRKTVGTVPTSDWASSVIFDKYSEALYAHPLAYRAASNGMHMGAPAVVTHTNTADGEPRVESLLQNDTVELVVGAEGFTAKDASVDKATDWTYEILMENTAGSASMRTIVAKGTPYAYYTFDNLSPTISLGAGATDLKIDRNTVDSNILGVSLKNKKDGKIRYYGLFAPKGTKWKNEGGKLTAALPEDGNYLSVAILPDNSDEAFALYEKYAFHFITDTKVEWEYHENAAKVYTRYNVTTTDMETGENGGDTIMALYPHQWRYLYQDTPTKYTYKTIRGTMKTIEGDSYVTEMTYHGMVTSLPATTDSKYLGDIKNQLGYLYDYRKNKGDPKWIVPIEWQYGGYDTYWVGKSLNVMTEAIFLADQFDDMKSMKDEMVNGIAGYLQYWFNPGDVYVNNQTGAVDSYFYYHKDYGTMIGYPASYSTDKEMNDHHFHYGYWIKAAAAVAMNNPDWAKQWGGMVYELIGDIANANRDGSSYNAKSTTKYPFLRNFDIYEGHSWASGVANYELDVNGNPIENGNLVGGNNQESSSEAVNAWASLILWGEAVGDTRIRDLGVYLYTTEIASVEEYYYDLYDEVFTEEYKDAKNFNIQTVTRLFGARYDHTAWWTENPIEVTTITMLPITGASLYMGKDKEKVKEVVESMSTNSKQWKNFIARYANNNSMQANTETNQDVRAMYQAFYDADAALKDYDYSDTGIVEGGESRAHTLAYITSLREYGTQNFDITGSTALSLVLEKNGKKTYIAENITDKTQRVYFSDGAYIDVPAKSIYKGEKKGEERNPGKDESEILNVERKFNLEIYCENINKDGYDVTKKTVEVESKDDTYTYQPGAIRGFTFDEDNEKNVLDVKFQAGSIGTIRVYYKRNTYSITYKFKEETIEIEDGITEYIYGSTMELPKPEIEGEEFLGWYTDAGFTGEALTEITATTEGDFILYAKCKSNNNGSDENESGNGTGNSGSGNENEGGDGTGNSGSGSGNESEGGNGAGNSGSGNENEGGNGAGNSGSGNENESGNGTGNSGSGSGNESEGGDGAGNSGSGSETEAGNNGSVNGSGAGSNMIKLDNPLLQAQTKYTKVVGNKTFTIKTAAQGTITFTSSNTKVATVGKTNGKVKVKKPGKAIITVQAAGDAQYKPAELAITVLVKPKAIPVKTAKAFAAKTVKVTWKKAKNITGYEVQYGTKKSFKDAKIVKVKKNSVILRGLKAGKKYYVRVRAYKNSDGTKVPGSWGKKKTVNISK